MIVRATEDRSLRRWAVQILGRVGTRDDIPLLRRIAETDPGSRTHEQRGVIYPIRELAAQAILDIRERHPPGGGH